MTDQTAQKAVTLTDIPETMLWTLHNRAAEAMRPGGILQDDKAIEIYRALDYDFLSAFGKPDTSHAVRSVVFDAAIRDFLHQAPEGVIVNLGEGLETQRFRIEAGQSLWLSVDVPDAIAIREEFITPDEHHRHIALSALDRSWFQEVPKGRPVFIAAQGLFMYFTPEEVEALVKDMAQAFPTARLMFDHIPPWFARKTLKGFWKTKTYKAPPMPWGIHRDQMAATLQSWLPGGSEGPGVQDITAYDYTFPRGFYRFIYLLARILPPLYNNGPGMTFCRFDNPKAA